MRSRRVRRRPGRLRRLVATTPLRLKLVATALVLSVLGLAVTGIAGVTQLRHYLVVRTDSQLMSAVHVFGQRDGGPGYRPPPDQSAPDGSADTTGTGAYPGTTGGGRIGAPPSGVPNFSRIAVQRLDANGKVLAATAANSITGDKPPALPPFTATTLTAQIGKPFTTMGADGEWRTLLTALPGGGAIAVSQSLDDVESTVAKLTRIDLVVSAIVLALLAGLGTALVRGNLRRLVEVEHTAEAIAAGDLTRRVPGEDGRSEVGRLAVAFNSMLGQIESAFRDREASEAAARASEDRMRRFVADASHELRTPLTSIRGFAELHRQGALPDAAAVTQAIGRIESEAVRMGGLVDDLLLLARLDQQRPLERRPVDLCQLARDAVTDGAAIDARHPVVLTLGPAARGSVQHGTAEQRTAEQRTAEQRTAASSRAVVVTGDESRLRQVLGNLLANTRMHTPAGTVTTISVYADGATAVLVVADDGPGLEPEVAARVFERFYRADPSRTRALGGSGLGLSIVAALVSAHDGTVELGTAPGSGARFVVRLPRREAPARIMVGQPPREHALSGLQGEVQAHDGAVRDT